MQLIIKNKELFWKSCFLFLLATNVIFLFKEYGYLIFEKPKDNQISEYKSGLNEGQVDSLIKLIKTFGADREVVRNVGSLLREPKDE
jgi:hypothetical protein